MPHFYNLFPIFIVFPISGMGEVDRTERSIKPSLDIHYIFPYILQKIFRSGKFFFLFKLYFQFYSQHAKEIYCNIFYALLNSINFDFSNC